MVVLESELVGKLLSLSQPSAPDISRTTEVLLDALGMPVAGATSWDNPWLMLRSAAFWPRFCLLLGNGKSTELGGWSPPKFWVLAEGGLCWLHIDSTSQWVLILHNERRKMSWEQWPSLVMCPLRHRSYWSLREAKGTYDVLFKTCHQVRVLCNL